MDIILGIVAAYLIFGVCYTLALAMMAQTIDTSLRAVIVERLQEKNEELKRFKNVPQGFLVFVVLVFIVMGWPSSLVKYIKG